MLTVTGVRFKRAGKIYYFDPAGHSLEMGDRIIAETVRGLELGTVVTPIKKITEEHLKSPLKAILKKADDNDYQIYLKNIEDALSAKKICEEKVSERDMQLKLTGAEYTFDRQKIIFYFTSDGRVDFRDLVRDLAGIFRTRIELRQIGVRDQAKMLNGIGPCGKCLCCASWQAEFNPVSIKMAKEQSLSLNPVKISGICGRLMCCLRYEYDTYRALNREMPKPMEIVKTPDGEALVFESDILRERVKCKLIVGFDEERNRPALDEDFSFYHSKVVVRENKRRFNFSKQMINNKFVQLQDQDDEVFAADLEKDDVGFLEE